VGRPNGIGWAVARRLQERGVDVCVQCLPGEDPQLPDATVLREDFTDPDAPERCVAAAAPLDILVVNHAYSSSRGLGELDAAEIDRALAVNVRASLLLVQAFHSRHDGREGGRVILMTSGQHRGSMPGELPYIAGKGALHQLTRSLAAAVAPKRITVNCVDPGATDTGWATPDVQAEVLAEEPFGRWGQPDDAARLIAFLCSDDGQWITGQVITSSGGGP
jgi:3-oxoacyl-[acyl-carrier protein] reductase